MITGLILMLKWSVHNLDSALRVCILTAIKKYILYSLMT